MSKLNDELAKIPAHKKRAALQKARWLRQFWDAADAAGNAAHRRRIAEQLVRSIKAKDPAAQISIASLWRWQKDWCAGGIVRLADRRGRRLKVERSVQEIRENAHLLSLSELLDQIITLLHDAMDRAWRMEKRKEA